MIGYYLFKSKPIKCFTSKYDVDKLGYYELHSSIVAAIEREKQIKGGSRAKKISLIETMNPAWIDLFPTLL